jgi:hypothetical protein
VTTDSEFVNAPKFTFSPGAEYSVALRSAGQLVGRVDYIYKSRIQYDYGNSPLIAQDPYGLLNARLTWQPPRNHPLSLASLERISRTLTTPLGVLMTVRPVHSARSSNSWALLARGCGCAIPVLVED